MFAGFWFGRVAAAFNVSQRSKIDWVACSARLLAYGITADAWFENVLSTLFESTAVTT